jgi:hypothetical protein
MAEFWAVNLQAIGVGLFIGGNFKAIVQIHYQKHAKICGQDEKQNKSIFMPDCTGVHFYSR